MAEKIEASESTSEHSQAKNISEGSSSPVSSPVKKVSPNNQATVNGRENGTDVTCPDKPGEGTHLSKAERRSYINYEVMENPNSIQASEADVDPRPYVNIAMRELSDAPSSTEPKAKTKETSPLRYAAQVSEPNLVLHSLPSKQGAGSKQAFADSKFKLLSSEKESTCKKCKELESVVGLWELGVSGLTRNYSKILSQLNKAREAARKLEGQVVERNEEMREKNDLGARNTSVSGRKAVTVRQSMYETNTAPLTAVRITAQMYPHDDDNSSELTMGQMKNFKVLSTHLAEAIDLCQQLAAASFKSNQQSISKRAQLKRQPTVPSKMTENDDTSPSYRPALQSIAEASFSSSFKKRTLERTPSAPDSALRGKRDQLLDAKSPVKSRQSPMVSGDKVPSKSEVADTAQSMSDEHVQDEAPAVSNIAGQSASTTSASQQPFVSHMMKLVSEEELDSERSTELSGESESKSDENRDSVLSMFSDTDVKQIMSKIADLEEVRVKLLATIDDLHKENNTVRLSLNDIFGDLQNKDLQLTLALQDLHLATGEIRKAAEMRRKLQEMETERSALYERLSNLEDESAAVKVSLIQLLQEKSATNKTLALENWRLNQRMKSAAAGSMSARRNGDGDNVSVNSAFSTVTEDAMLQEAYMGADDVAPFVHKQGFLVKQGGRRKNWKRRLFVLSPNGLSYYKTEQPLQIIPISNINKVQICHGSTLYPHMFEVYTPGRVFLLSAPSEDEMQSWVGMLQTLKQYNKGTTLNREASTRRELVVEGGASPSPRIKPINGELDLADSSPELRGAGPQHEDAHERASLAIFKKEGAGPYTGAMSSEEEDEQHLVIHQNHFGSDEDTFEGSPMSVPALNPLEEFSPVCIPQVKPRLRSDST